MKRKAKAMREAETRAGEAGKEAGCGIVEQLHGFFVNYTEKAYLFGLIGVLEIELERIHSDME